ncbi:electron transfer flavoprotein subunit alpha [Photobacterium sanctipauli]|uniref:Electron transfer flavoprotein subunit alpha n=1 Tax=Photobacterium sanctipauli TaxID=1342794 RepID=A0A2T3NVF0_9GAMM|nr:FAD-binding protein [Photobacterium sanctipauli]PSW20254.1 electron transfer flavoprotein subunit alpha [Photobacterium sanctipauli]
MKALIIASHDHQALATETLKVVSAAKALAMPIDVLIAGQDCSQVAESASKMESISTVLVADNPCYQHQLAENLSSLIAELSSDYTHILAPATTFGKNLLPRVAALLDVGMLSDVVAIESEDTVVRPVYAGNALARVQSLDAIKLITVRASAFPVADKVDTASPLVAVEQVIENAFSQYVRLEQIKSERPELTAARVVVSGGRGLANKESFALVEQLADKLDGAIGASRAAVDAGFVPNDMQVGQTGKIVAPELYIAVGISGAIQHLAGMKDSKVIVAINSDPDAPIFQIADYGLVGDLFDILPEFIEALD